MYNIYIFYFFRVEKVSNDIELTEATTFSDESTSTITTDESCEEGEISSVDEIVFNHNDNNNINNPAEIKWSFDVNLNNNQVKEKIPVEKPLMSYSFDLGTNTVNDNSYKSTEKIPVEKPLMPYSFDLGVNAVNDNSYKSTEKIPVEKPLMPYSFDLGIDTVNNNSHKTKEKIPVEKSLMTYSFDLVGVGDNSTITTPSISVNKKGQKRQKECDKFSLKPLPPIIKNLGNKSKISSCLGGPIHNLLASTIIFKNNPQMSLAELVRKCDTLTLPRLMNKTNLEDYREEITKKFFNDGYDDLEKSLEPWILDL
ncbi:8985_t:CDS:2 [Entrophospora sp. SA101]|nr:8985_t:CDS:2 [Entrophospora sp. SA101]